MTLTHPAKDDVYLVFFYFTKLIMNQGFFTESSVKQFLRDCTKVSALTIVYALWNVIFISDNVVENVLSSIQLYYSTRPLRL